MFIWLSYMAPEHMTCTH